MGKRFRLIWSAPLKVWIVFCNQCLSILVKNQLLQLTFFQSFCILCNNQMVDTILDISIHESCQIVYRIIDTVIGYTSLWIIVCADFSRTVSCADHCFTFRCNIVDILLMLFIIDESVYWLILLKRQKSCLTMMKSMELYLQKIPSGSNEDYSQLL